MMTTVLAIDPGREKCGLAIVSSNGLIHKDIIIRGNIITVTEYLINEIPVDRIIVGNGTGGKKLADEIHKRLRTPVDLVDETMSSCRARVRYLDENPPKGIRRLIPRGLVSPDRPYDDYVACILAEEYLGSVISDQ